MINKPQALSALLKVAPTVALNATFSRVVPLGDLLKNSPPDFLFTSGRPNRYNPRGVECVYFSETEEVANLEYTARLRGFAVKFPKVIYCAEARLAKVLDLTLPGTLNALGISDAALFQTWRGAKQTWTQNWVRRWPRELGFAPFGIRPLRLETLESLAPTSLSTAIRFWLLIW